MSPFPGHVLIVSRVDHVLSKENMDADRACADQKIAAVICSTSCISHLWYATERDRVHKNRYEASGIDPLSDSGARGWTSFKRNILYAIRSLKINTRDHGSAAILTYIQSSGKQTHVLPSLPCKMARKTSTPMQIMCYEKKVSSYMISHMDIPLYKYMSIIQRYWYFFKS